MAKKKTAVIMPDKDFSEKIRRISETSNHLQAIAIGIAILFQEKG